MHMEDQKDNLSFSLATNLMAKTTFNSLNPWLCISAKNEKTGTLQAK